MKSNNQLQTKFTGSYKKRVYDLYDVSYIVYFKITPQFF